MWVNCSNKLCEATVVGQETWSPGCHSLGGPQCISPLQWLPLHNTTTAVDSTVDPTALAYSACHLAVSEAEYSVWLQPPPPHVHSILGRWEEGQKGCWEWEGGTAYPSGYWGTWNCGAGGGMKWGVVVRGQSQEPGGLVTPLWGSIVYLHNFRKGKLVETCKCFFKVKEGISRAKLISSPVCYWLWSILNSFP